MGGVTIRVRESEVMFIMFPCLILIVTTMGISAEALCLNEGAYLEVFFSCGTTLNWVTTSQNGSSGLIRAIRAIDIDFTTK